MLAFYHPLYRHQAWADAALLTAVQSQAACLEDSQLLKTLNHIVMVQRFFLSQFQEWSIDVKTEYGISRSFPELVALFRRTNEEELAFVSSAEEGILERRFELQFLQSSPTIGEGLMQVVMHSQNHRGQCLTRMRENGAKPPTLDYILWAKEKLDPQWPLSRPLLSPCSARFQRTRGRTLASSVS